MERLVLKIGGSELEAIAYGAADDFVAGLITAVRALQKEVAVVLVHGGGKTIANLQAQLGLEARFVDGLRVTDDASLDVAEMVLSGLTNKRLAARFVSVGMRAVGLSGIDDGLIRVNRLSQPGKDWGWVGDVTGANTSLLEALLDQGIVPIISPISLGLDGHSYNVNADHAAAALASALGARELVFVSNVPGVLAGSSPTSADKICLPLLSPGEVEALIVAGEINGGMIPKVRSALAALERGVERVRIANLEGLVCGEGTCFVRQEQVVH
ncbi:MAG: acetylglutamate kinase [Anaerolineae bacterium]|nr:acetylglutamate kinase [Anaerolineae bacterium]